jgi:hypothetical protein
LDTANRIFIIEKIQESNLEFRKIPLSNNISCIHRDDDSVKSFFALNIHGRLLNIPILSIDDLDKYSSQVMNLESIQNSIKKSLQEIDENTKIYEEKKKESDNLNDQIVSLNTISHLFSDRNFNIFEILSNKLTGKNENKIEFEIRNQSKFNISKWKGTDLFD